MAVSDALWKIAFKSFGFLGASIYDPPERILAKYGVFIMLSDSTKLTDRAYDVLIVLCHRQMDRGSVPVSLLLKGSRNTSRIFQ
jgi:hypothetical protein